jgi:hypothetical protein
MGAHPSSADQGQRQLATGQHGDRARQPGGLQLQLAADERGAVGRGHRGRGGARIIAQADPGRAGEGAEIGGGLDPVPGEHRGRPQCGYPRQQGDERAEGEHPHAR